MEIGITRFKVISLNLGEIKKSLIGITSSVREVGEIEKLRQWIEAVLQFLESVLVFFESPVPVMFLPVFVSDNHHLMEATTYLNTEAVGVTGMDLIVSEDVCELQPINVESDDVQHGSLVA
ncbi:hypothetical protein L2E82_28460 [Cichorium intybus]|uniref:Uncharacterized protein n=1 Tax=Cichorium intybus TaxID=13427 RepID=A0ACB9CVQ8_CICIN|nr:hypothetical protein L2E82_28460 [Cichorium intybus]